MNTTHEYGTIELKASVDALVPAVEELRRYIASRPSAPYFLAPTATPAPLDPREAIANSLCLLHFRGPVKPHLHTGVLLIDNEGKELASRVNEAKNNFGTIAKSMNRRTIGAARAQQLHEALRVIGHSDAWLQQCYRKIQIIDGRECTRISFTWQRNHSSREVVSLAQALALCDFYAKDEGEQYERWKAKLQQINHSKYQIVRLKTDKQPQMKANLTLGKGKQPETRERISSPKILLLCQNRLPVITYKDQEQLRSPSVVRSDKKTLDDFALGFLNLYATPRPKPTQNQFEDEVLRSIEISELESYE